MYKKIANKGHEEMTTMSSRDMRGRPLSKRMRREKSVRNRYAKRKEARRAFEDAQQG